jgi:hypothetical protein
MGNPSKTEYHLYYAHLLQNCPYDKHRQYIQAILGTHALEHEMK